MQAFLGQCLMGTLDPFLIPVTGLKPGNHLFDFRIDASFFSQFEYGEIKEGLVEVRLEIMKEAKHMDINFHIKGKVVVPCDRCSDPVMISIEGDRKLIAKFGNEYQEVSDEIQIIPDTVNRFDVRSYIFEYIQLLIPQKREHQTDHNGVSQCNPEVLKKLRELTGEHRPDPRWEILGQYRESIKIHHKKQ